MTQGRFKTFFASPLLVAALVFAGCSSSPQATKPSRPTISVDQDRMKIDNILSWLSARSVDAKSLHVTGNISLSDGKSSRSAQFDLRDKRLTATVGATGAVNSERIDSLSIIVTGPFGIGVARFMASPVEYIMYNALEGESYSGSTDATALESLTQLKGVTLSAMSDGLYGLAPGSDLISAHDSITLLKVNDDTHILLVQRFIEGFTEALTLKGVGIESGLPIAPTQLTLTMYERFNTILTTYGERRQKADIQIKYSLPSLYGGIAIPKTVEVRSRENTLVMEYDDVVLNPAQLTVRIKVPRR